MLKINLISLAKVRSIRRNLLAAERFQRRYASDAGLRKRMRGNVLRRKFGATQTQIDEQIAYQDGCCAICKQELRGGLFQHIDHDHTKPGTFRGVLCAKCNTGIGKFDENPEWLERAAAYLRRGGSRP